ncbi:MAG: cohesin domain-containing protein [Candidatus Bathyarchaeia archaeon]
MYFVGCANSSACFAPFFSFVFEAKASSGEANVYILELSTVPTDGVINQDQIRIGAINACLPTGNYIQFNGPRAHPKRNVDYSPWYQVTPEAVTTWSRYREIVESTVGSIIVNTHGAYLPVPNTYNKTAWVDKISESMSTRRLSWIHCGGYTFHKVYYENGTNEGDWTEVSGNGTTIGAGFRRLMSTIGIQDADLLTPIGVIHHPTTTFADYDAEPRTSWQLNAAFEAPVGNPLRNDQFGEYNAFPLFYYTDPDTGKNYWPGAVVPFSNVNQRSMSSNGPGTYVHLGIGSNFTDGTHSGDYLKGLIGTAAAACLESWNFQGKFDAYSNPVGVLTIQNGTLAVQPLISNVYYTDQSSNLAMDLVFPIYGAIQSGGGLWATYQSAYFLVEPTNNEWNWQDVWTNAKMSDSREGKGYGDTLNGFGSGVFPLITFLALGLMWFLGVPGLLGTSANAMIARYILWGLGGVRLAAQWASYQCQNYWGGIDSFDHYSEYIYAPHNTVTTNGSTTYSEFITFQKVTVKIPVTGRYGWRTLPLHYRVNATANWYNAYPPPLSVDDTLQISVWFDGAGQNDAGHEGDAGNTLATATYATPNAVFHGYLYGQDPDPEDWYTFNFSDSNKKGIYFDMTPPNYVDFDVRLYNSSGLDGLVASSNNPAGQTEHVKTYGNLFGPWYIRIYPGSDSNSISHSGVYSCSLSSLTGDINLDESVDIYDAILFAKAFNSCPGNPNWNASADMNNDNCVDIYDAILLAGSFGHSVGGASGQSSQIGTPAMGANTMLNAGAAVAVNPSQLTVFKGETFAVSVTITNVNDLSGWEFKLYWNSNLLNCTNAVVQTPTEWQNNTQNFGAGLQPTYNATCARYWMAQAATYPAPSFNGSMNMATLTFQALQPGTTSLTLTDVKLGNSTAQPIACSVSSGSVNVYYGRYMRSDTQTINGLNAYKLNIPESTSSAYVTQSGSGYGASWGIRAWVRHSNGVEQEISLDGQTGTPKAVVWRSSGSGIQGGTVSVAQAGLQQTDSLVIRVYVQVGGSGWTLCATFTTEQLQATTLQATTWTAYYYTYAYYIRPYNWTTSTFYWGTTTYNSRIQNLQFG